ncbi:hypothetical protein JQC67_17120 [Aurantibacter crassamenti]|uniref:hypothetical protein n=1 Tax=Aurantibacter crassamenti TaxID=1837375 RepID=UPI001939877C|nr:hypothetical protein [Aurantibacter crassamenti]MBM1107879.1 hypothetical protein [Aurantibacter crassamenti]
MKNNILLIAFILFSITITAQKGFKLGIHGSLPLGENKKVVSLGAGIDVGYMYPLGEVVDLGVMTGFINGFPETFHEEVVLRDLPNVQFVPVALGLRIWPSNSFSFGGEIGNAFGMNDGNEGGIYYKPIIGLLFGAQVEVNLSYTNVVLDGEDWSTANLGVLYTFPPKNPY